jgi:hypothetical protein
MEPFLQQQIGRININQETENYINLGVDDSALQVHVVAGNGER